MDVLRGSTQQLTGTGADTHSRALDGVLHERDRGKNEGAERDGNPTERPSESTKLGLLEVPEAKPPTKEVVWPALRSQAHM